MALQLREVPSEASGEATDSEIMPAGEAAAPPPPPAPLPPGLAALPPQHAAAMQQAMQALASGQHPELLQQVSTKMGLTPDQLRQTAAAIGSGSDQGIPSEVVQRAMQLQWAMRGGALPPMGPAAASAVPPGMPPGLLGSLAAANGGGGGGMMLPPGASSAPAPSSDVLLLDSEDQQGCFDLYRRAYGRHMDFIFPPVYVAAASLALWTRLLPFWLALLLVPLGFVLGVQLVLVKGKQCLLDARASAPLCCRPCHRPEELGAPAGRCAASCAAARQYRQYRLQCCAAACAASFLLSASSRPVMACRCRHPGAARPILEAARSNGGQPGSAGGRHLLLAGKLIQKQLLLLSYLDLRQELAWPRHACAAQPVHALSIRLHASLPPQMQPWLTDRPWQCLIFTALSATFAVLHYRCAAGYWLIPLLPACQPGRWLLKGGPSCSEAATLSHPPALSLLLCCVAECRSSKVDPGFLEAKGQPAPLAPAQRMMLASQARYGWCCWLVQRLLFGCCCCLVYCLIRLPGWSCLPAMLRVFWPNHLIPPPAPCPCRRTPRGATHATSTSPSAPSTAAPATGERRGAAARQPPWLPPWAGCSPGRPPATCRASSAAPLLPWTSFCGLPAPAAAAGSAPTTAPRPAPAPACAMVQVRGGV